MKTLLTICFFLLLIIRFSYSQQIQFENDPLPEVMAKANFYVDALPAKAFNSFAEAPNSGYYDTLAHLLYRLEFYTEAEDMQESYFTDSSALSVSAHCNYHRTCLL